MDNKRSVYLMSGGRGASEKSTTSIIRTIFRDMAVPVPTIAYVGVASGDNWVFYQFILRMIKNAGECRIDRIVIGSKKADLEKARESLKSADAVFMSGGDVEAGMKTLEDKNMTGLFRDLYQQGKLYFGASAGSIMLVKEWVRWRNPDDDSTSELFPCLGLAPLICDTHSEEDDWEELKAALSLEKDGVKGYGITSGSCLKVSPEGGIEALGGAVYQYIHKGEKVERLPDILPLKIS
jgi:peptidase E